MKILMAILIAVLLIVFPNYVTDEMMGTIGYILLVFASIWLVSKNPYSEDAEDLDSREL